MSADATKQKISLPSAKEAQKRLATAMAEEAAECTRAQAAEQAEKQRLIEKLSEPSGVSDEEAMQRVAVIIQRAISNGLHEVQVYRFPNPLCTDRGRAISQVEAGWEKTLRGVPAEIFALWHRQLRPLGYKIRFEIIDWPGGFPGDIGITLHWT